MHVLICTVVTTADGPVGLELVYSDGTVRPRSIYTRLRTLVGGVRTYFIEYMHV